MKEFFEFIRSKSFFALIFRAVGILIVLVCVVSIVLRIYTFHNRAIDVPDFSGLTIQEATHLAEENHLKLNVIDSVFVSDKKRGSVIEQNPTALSKVKKFRTIFITMNAMKPALIDMPDVTQVSLRQAEAMLDVHGLKLGNTIYRPHIAKDYVLDQLFQNRPIKKGASIVKGSKIDLILGTGPTNEKTFIPDITFMTLTQAQDTLNKLMLNFGSVISDNSAGIKKDSMNAVIFRQEPKPDLQTTINLGSYIHIWITSDSTRNTITP